MEEFSRQFTLEERAELYNHKFPNYPPIAYTKRWIYGMWVIGNNYRRKVGYYGEYPPSYLDRITALFPDARDILHLFSGSLTQDIQGLRLDSNPDCKPDIIGNAESLSLYLPEYRFDVIYADPPYSQEDAEHYGSPMCNRNRVVGECAKVLKTNGFLVWLDQVLPMYRKAELLLVGTIGLIQSTNHRFRVVSIFGRTGGEMPGGQK